MLRSMSRILVFYAPGVANIHIRNYRTSCGAVHLYQRFKLISHRRVARHAPRYPLRSIIVHVIRPVDGCPSRCAVYGQAKPEYLLLALYELASPFGGSSLSSIRVLMKDQPIERSDTHPPIRLSSCICQSPLFRPSVLHFSGSTVGTASATWLLSISSSLKNPPLRPVCMCPKRTSTAQGLCCNHVSVSCRGMPPHFLLQVSMAQCGLKVFDSWASF